MTHDSDESADPHTEAVLLLTSRRFDLGGSRATTRQKEDFGIISCRAQHVESMEHWNQHQPNVDDDDLRAVQLCGGAAGTSLQHIRRLNPQGETTRVLMCVTRRKNDVQATHSLHFYGPLLS